MQNGMNTVKLIQSTVDHRPVTSAMNVSMYILARRARTMVTVKYARPK
jgi:hypothetical protein